MSAGVAPDDKAVVAARVGIADQVEDWSTRLGAVAAALAGLVVIVHLLGGVVMWLRFKTAHLPADQAVALMSREQMLTIGVRLMVLPAVASVVLVATILTITGVEGQRHRMLRPLGRAGLVVVTVAAILCVSFSWASATWLALLLVPLYRWYDLRRRADGARRSSWGLVIVAVLVAAVVSLGRQIDEPVQLLHMRIVVTGQKHAVDGVFVNADADSVYVGSSGSGTIKGYRRSDVRSLSVGPPQDLAPSPSILSRLAGGNGWAVTPLSMWCNGARYTWNRVGDACQTQPTVHDRHRWLDLGRLPVHLSCPKEAKEGCSGYVRLRTERTYSDELGAEVPRHAFFPHEREKGKRFTVAAGREGKLICVPTQPDEEKALERIARVDRKREIPMRVILSSDPLGENVIREQTGYGLAVDPIDADPSLIHTTGCTDDTERKRLAEQKAASLTPVGATLKGAQGRGAPWTVDVRMGNGDVRVHLLGIGDFGTGKDKERQGCMRDEAAAVLGRWVTDGRVRLEPDPASGDRDLKSQLLRYVTPAGEHDTLQEDLVREGWAKPTTDTALPLQHWRDLEAAAQQAKRYGRGIWSARPGNRLGQTICPPTG